MSLGGQSITARVQRVPTVSHASLFQGIAPEPSQRGWHAMDQLRARLVPEVATAPVERYTFGERLGEGGLGVVYAAHDKELDREVAIKVLRPEVTDRDGQRAVARLVREARAMARLTHPNVVEVFDIREHPTGTFVVMEHLRGCTLGKWLNQPGRSLSQVLAVMRAAGEGLLAAHRVGLVHRDFKPANVIVCSDGQVKVLDFGLARQHRTNDTPSDDPNATQPGADPVTRTGVVMGTPSYMAPEQHSGQDADVRCDQYAFAVTLFRALYGVMPFYATSSVELLSRKMAMALPDALPAFEVPRRLHAAIRRALSPMPSDRFPSMQSLLEELTPRSRRRAWLPGIGALAVGALLAVAAAPEVARLASDRGTLDEAPVETVADETTLPADVTERAEQLIDDADTATSEGRRLEALAMADELITLGREHDNAHYQLAGLHTRARARHLGGEYLLAAEDAVEEVLLAEASGDDTQALRAAAMAVSSLTAAGKLEDATHWSRTIDALLERTDHEGAVQVEAIGAQAALLRHLADPDGARAKFEHALEIGRNAEGAKRAGKEGIEPFTMAATRANLAATLMDLGDLPASNTMYREATAAFTALLGASHPTTATSMMNEGITAMHLARHDEARERLDQARAVFVEHSAPGSDHVAFCDYSLGVLEGARGNHTAALEFLHRARTGFEQAHGDQHFTLVRTAIATVNALVDAGRYGEAIRTGEEGRRIAEHIVGPDHPLTAYATSAIGRAQLSAGVPEAAITLEAALRILEDHTTPADELANAQFELAQALWIDVSQRGRARAMAQSARRLVDSMEGEASLRRDIDAWLQAR